MSLATWIFGRTRGEQASAKERVQIVDHPPRGVEVHEVRPKGEAQVRARKSGRHYVVEHRDGDKARVRADIFKRTYRRVGLGRYAKRPDLTYRYFTFPHAVLVDTLEGMEIAEAGDWIMIGVAGELWPIPQEKAAEKYLPI